MVCLESVFKLLALYGMHFATMRWQSYNWEGKVSLKLIYSALYAPPSNCMWLNNYGLLRRKCDWHKSCLVFSPCIFLVGNNMWMLRFPADIMRIGGSTNLCIIFMWNLSNSSVRFLRLFNSHFVYITHVKNTFLKQCRKSYRKQRRFYVILSIIFVAFQTCWNKVFCFQFISCVHVNTKVTSNIMVEAHNSSNFSLTLETISGWTFKFWLVIALKLMFTRRERLVASLKPGGLLNGVVKLCKTCMQTNI